MAQIHRVQVGKSYEYQPVGCDKWDPRTTLTPGTIVTVVNPPGCPRANTNGHCFVSFEGKLAGLILCNSLKPLPQE